MKSGNLNFPEPSGPPRPVTGLIYLTCSFRHSFVSGWSESMSTCVRTYAHAFQIWITLVSLHLLCRSRKRNDMWVHPWNRHGRSSQLTSLLVERIWSTSAKQKVITQIPCVILSWNVIRNIEHLIKECWTAVNVKIMSVRLLSLVSCRFNRGQDIYCIAVCLLKSSKYWKPQF